MPEMTRYQCHLTLLIPRNRVVKSVAKEDSDGCALFSVLLDLDRSQ
jgi:hypothetical protein